MMMLMLLLLLLLLLTMMMMTMCPGQLYPGGGVSALPVAGGVLPHAV
jgi:hypothetical protein